MTRTTARKTFLFDVFTTAFEGGIDYWAGILRYRWSLGAPNYEPDLNGFQGIIVDTEDEESAKHRIDADAIARGLGVLRRGPVVGLHEDTRKRLLKADRENEAGDIDASDADVIVQCAVFGEVVYG